MENQIIGKREIEEFINTLSELVKIPSRSNDKSGEEEAVQNFVAEKMRQAGADVFTFEPADVPGFFDHPLCCGPGRKYVNRPTVIGDVGKGDDTLIVMAHSDTVEVFDPDKWSVDPFSGLIKDNMVWGLGSVDDKWGTAAMISLIKLFSKQEINPEKKIRFISTIDEESGVGNGLLLLMLKGITGSACIYLDGGIFDICIGNMGGSSFNIRPVNNPSDEDFEIIYNRVNEFCVKESSKRSVLFDFNEYFANNWCRERSLIAYKRKDLQGNYILLAFYTLPGEDKENITAYISKGIESILNIGDFNISIREPWFEPALVQRDEKVIDYMACSIKEVTGKNARINTISKQDAFIFNNHAKIPTISFGVGKREGDGANHNPDERVSIDDAAAGLKVVYNTLEKWLKGD